MKHIFWCIQQLDRVGGTEAVSITIANELVNRYDVTLVVTAKSEKSVFQIDPRIKIYSLGVDPKITKFDESSQYDISHFKFGKYIKLVNSTASAYVYKRNKYRNQLQKLLDDNPDSLMICSSLDNYLYAPKRGLFSARWFSTANCGPSTVSLDRDPLLLLGVYSGRSP